MQTGVWKTRVGLDRSTVPLASEILLELGTAQLQDQHRYVLIGLFTKHVVGLRGPHIAFVNCARQITDDELHGHVRSLVAAQA